jgi:hypothetical protein
MSPPSSKLNNKPSKKPEDAGGRQSFHNGFFLDLFLDPENGA